MESQDKKQSNPSNTNSKASIVVIGGGTGIHSLLRGLKKYTNDITAIVSMMDSGGSSGRLRDEFGQLPPGDSRQALVALTPDDRSSLVLRQLFNYRFAKGNGLEGHSFGNLFLTALTEITGDADKAISQAGSILGIRGRVIPVTLTSSDLVARLEDGSEIVGETNIDTRKEKLDVPIDYVYLKPKAYANSRALEAIEKADVIVIGPGDLYTSLIPNLLVDGIKEAIKDSKANKIYISNIMTKHGESDNFKASTFIEEITTYLGYKNLEYAVINKSNLPEKILKRYEKEVAFPVNADLKECRQLAKKVIVGDFVLQDTFVRHDGNKLAKLIIDLSSNKKFPPKD